MIPLTDMSAIPSHTTRVLVVEDERIVAKDIQQTLSEVGYAVVGMAGSGREAVAMAKDLHPSLVVMDIRLPGQLDGIQAAAEIRRQIDVPVIFLTAFSDVETVRRAVTTEPFGYVLKPFTATELNCAIQVALCKHRAEALLRNRERLLATTLRSIADGVITADANESVTFLNPVAESMTGWSSIDATGRPLADVLRLRNEHGGQSDLSPMTEAMISGKTTILSEGTVLLPRNGVPVPVADSAAPIKDEKGDTLGGVIVFRDVSERRRAEAERELLLNSERQARAAAEAADRAKDEFLATVSHELRTPLNAILGWSSMLAAGHLDEATSLRALKTIARCARHQAQLVDDLLDVSRIMTGSLRLDVQPVELGSVVEQTIAAFRPAAEAKAIHLQMAIDPNVYQVAGDPIRLQQIAWNLLSNAVKFTPDGGSVQITLGQVGSCVQLAVSDSGRGMSEDFLPFAFERFRQADGSSTRDVPGLGLGLAIVRHLVALHGGTVAAHSDGIGRGATFTVSLPIAAEQPRPDRRQRARMQTDAPDDRVISATQLLGVTVLVVDDDPETQELLRSILTLAGAETLRASSAAEALDALARSRPDIIVCDIGMPNEGGYSLIRKIRSRSEAEGGRIPAVALTAYTRREDRTRALLAGFQSHVVKPVEPAELLAVVGALAPPNLPLA